MWQGMAGAPLGGGGEDSPALIRAGELYYELPGTTAATPPYLYLDCCNKELRGFAAIGSSYFKTIGAELEQPLAGLRFASSFSSFSPSVSTAICILTHSSSALRPHCLPQSASAYFQSTRKSCRDPRCGFHRTSAFPDRSHFDILVRPPPCSSNRVSSTSAACLTQSRRTSHSPFTIHHAVCQCLPPYNNALGPASFSNPHESRHDSPLPAHHPFPSLADLFLLRVVARDPSTAF